MKHLLNLAAGVLIAIAIPLAIVFGLFLLAVKYGPSLVMLWWASH